MRLVMTIAALLGLGACSWFQDPCARATGDEMRALDRQIAAAERDADGTYHGRLHNNGGGQGDYLCRSVGAGKVACAPVAARWGGKRSGSGAIEDPHARLAELRVQRQAVLRLMMHCQG